MPHPDDIPTDAGLQIDLLPSTLTLWSDRREMPAFLPDLILRGDTAALFEMIDRIPEADLTDFGFTRLTMLLPGEPVGRLRHRLLQALFGDFLADEWMTAAERCDKLGPAGRIHTRMTNRAMQTMLNTGKAVDVSVFERNAEGDYLLTDFAEGSDYCDAAAEAWIWSIGRHIETGRIFASTGGRFYQRPGFTCLFIR